MKEECEIFTFQNYSSTAGYLETRRKPNEIEHVQNDESESIAVVSRYHLQILLINLYMVWFQQPKSDLSFFPPLQSLLY